MEDKEKIYSSGEYLENNPNWHEGDAEWKANEIEKIIIRNNLDVKNIAELGSGSGAILNALQSKLPHCRKFTGYDMSPQAIDISKKFENEKLKFYCLDITKEKVDPHQVMLLIDVIEHVDDYMGFLKTIKDMSDYCIFHIPIDMYALAVLLDYQMTVREVYGHVHYFSKSTALKSLEDSGFTIIDWFYTKAGWELPAEGKVNATKAKLLKYPRKLLFSVSPDFAAKSLGGCSIMVLAKRR